MLTLVERDIVKQFKRAASTTHGIVITSVNPMVKSFNCEGEKMYKKRNIKTSEFAADLHLKKRMVCY
jgi:hypothetical protein